MKRKGGPFSLAFASLISLVALGPSFASLDLCADEYLLMFADRKQVSSVSFLAKDANETALARQARGIPANDGSIESVLRHKPTILLTTRSPSPAQQRLANRLGMKIVMLPFAQTPSDVSNNVDQVASLVDSKERGAAWQRRFNAVKSQTNDKRKMLWIGSTSTSLGPTNSAWLSLAGIDVEQPRAGLSRIEQVAASTSPLLVSAYRDDQYSRNAAWRDHPLVRSRMAGRTNVDGRAFTCGGPMMLGVVEGLVSR